MVENSEDLGMVNNAKDAQNGEVAQSVEAIQMVEAW